ncbi:hypothetical protein NHG32_08220 [Aerococcaceae bacterium NML191219]|nr:hypothetical protein [Aerococcaceae bacterium NML191219]
MAKLLIERKIAQLFLHSNFFKEYDNGVLNPIVEIIEEYGLVEETKVSENLETMYKTLKDGLVQGCRNEWWYSEGKRFERCTKGVCELCGNPRIKKYYFVKNKVNGTELKIGSRCIEVLLNVQDVPYHGKFKNNPKSHSNYMKLIYDKPTLKEALLRKQNSHYLPHKYKIVLPSSYILEMNHLLNDLIKLSFQYAESSSISMLSKIDNLLDKYEKLDEKFDDYYNENRCSLDFLLNEELQEIFHEDRKMIAETISNNEGKMSALIASKISSIKLYERIMRAYQTSPKDVSILSIVESKGLYYQVNIESIVYMIRASEFIKNYCNYLFKYSNIRDNSLNILIAETVDDSIFNDSISNKKLEKLAIEYVEQNFDYIQDYKLFDKLKKYHSHSNRYLTRIEKLESSYVSFKKVKTNQVVLLKVSKCYRLGLYQLRKMKNNQQINEARDLMTEFTSPVKLADQIYNDINY